MGMKNLKVRGYQQHYTPASHVAWVAYDDNDHEAWRTYGSLFWVEYKEMNFMNVAYSSLLELEALWK